MGKRRPKYIEKIIQFIIILFLLTGCTIVYPPPNINMIYPEQNKIYLSIELQLTKQFRTYEWVYRLGSLRARIPLGEVLEKQATILATTLFQNVIITQGERKDVNRNASLILTPRIISLDFSPTFIDAQDVAIYLEWTFAMGDGKIVYSKTIEGVGLGKKSFIGSQTDSYRKKLIRLATEDLFQRSYEEISTSPEIRRFSNSH